MLGTAGPLVQTTARQLLPRWLPTASQRSTRPCSSIASCASKRPWRESRKKLSSWRITSGSWWRRSAKKQSEWRESKRRAEEVGEDGIPFCSAHLFYREILLELMRVYSECAAASAGDREILRISRFFY